MLKKLNMKKNQKLIKIKKLINKIIQKIMKQFNKINQWKLIHHNKNIYFLFIEIFYFVNLFISLFFFYLFMDFIPLIYIQIKL